MLRGFLTRTAKRYLPFEKVNLVWATRINGKKIKVPVIRGLRAAFTEPWMLDLFAKIFNQSKGTFLDVGANLGQTLIKVKCMDPQWKYVGFEPNPACCFYLRELIELNGFENCMIVPIGLMNKDGLLQLDFFSGNCADSMASLIEGFRPNKSIHHRTLVPVFRFDSISSVCGLDDIGFIKIDVEGAEVEVIESLRNKIHVHRPVIILEILPVYESSNTVRRKRQGRLLSLLRSLDYVLFRVKKRDSQVYSGLQEIDTIGIHSDLACCDYVAIPEERKERFCWS